jgi:hypothetical protein
MKYCPSPCPSRKGERGNILKFKENVLPLDGGGTGWGWKMNFFTLSGGEGDFAGYSSRPEPNPLAILV